MEITADCQAISPVDRGLGIHDISCGNGSVLIVFLHSSGVELFPRGPASPGIPIQARGVVAGVLKTSAVDTSVVNKKRFERFL